MTADAEDVARQAAAALWENDAASHGLGMEIEAVGPGHARLAMTVEPRMLNGHGMCHGGFIFSLADSAFAFACNSRGHAAVAQTCSITFLRPVRPGERLVATATELALAGRSGLYDIHVTGEGGARVAEFRGQSRAVSIK